MWICKYCETKNDAGDHCFLCGFFNAPALEAAASEEVKLPEKEAITPGREEKPAEKAVVPERDKMPGKTVMPPVHETPAAEPVVPDRDYRTESAPGRYADGFSFIDKRLVDEKRRSLTARRNKKKQNKIKAAFAVVNILLAAANGLVCYFVFR